MLESEANTVFKKKRKKEKPGGRGIAAAPVLQMCVRELCECERGGERGDAQTTPPDGEITAVQVTVGT